jgi:hypothetical protein
MNTSAILTSEVGGEGDLQSAVRPRASWPGHAVVRVEGAGVVLRQNRTPWRARTTSPAKEARPGHVGEGAAEEEGEKLWIGSGTPPRDFPEEQG